MLYKLQGRPLWYKIWAIATALVALYTVIKFGNVIVTGALVEVLVVDFILATLVQVSVLLDMYLFPKSDREQERRY